MVTFDITKTFDAVCYKRLYDHYRIRGTAFKLMLSYLNNRLYYVCINNIESNRRNVLMGIPRDSVLGALLFIIYINDPQNFLKSIP